MELRNYQQRIVSEVNSALHRVPRVVCVAPTGAGKRILICWWCRRIAELGRRVAVVTNRRLLVRAVARECENLRIPYGILMGNAPDNPEAPVQVCSIQTLRSREWRENPVADWVIVDETHQEVDGYRELFLKYPSAKKLGFTATPVNAHGKCLAPGLFDQIVEPVKNSELIREGWLLPTTAIVPSEPEMEGIHPTPTGEYNQEELGKRVEACTSWANLWNEWRDFSDLQTIAFVPRLYYARGLAIQFRQQGFKAELIEASTPDRERKKILERFEDTQKTRVLISVDVLRTGVDLPIAQCLIDLQPNKQLRTYWQKLGRIKRPYGDQPNAIYLDMAGNFWNFYHPDEDPVWPTKGESVMDSIKQRTPSDPGEPKKWVCPKCFYALSPWEKSEGRCPGCGYQSRKAIRRVRMLDGTVREVSAEERRKKAVSVAQKTWTKCVYRAHYSKPRRKLGAALAMYKNEMGGNPPLDLKQFPPPPPGSKWKLYPHEVYGDLR